MCFFILGLCTILGLHVELCVFILSSPLSVSVFISADNSSHGATVQPTEHCGHRHRPQARENRQQTPLHVREREGRGGRERRGRRKRWG